MLGYAQKGGIADIEKAKPKLVMLLGADEVRPTAFKGAFKVYIGHHGDAGAKMADLVLPGAPMPKSTAPTSTPKGACSGARGGLSAGRGARGLDDPTRGVASLRARSCRSTVSTSCARDGQGPSRLGRDGLIDSMGAAEARSKAEGRSAMRSATSS
jgi:NADH-quinone oxidoreductase subunit G